jgi:N-glycosylase/DNA lyase
MKLSKKIARLKKSEAGKKIRERVAELKANQKHFHELCFCLTTANSRARAGLKAQEKPDNFECLNEKALAEYLKECGVRFHNVKAANIVNARRLKKQLPEALALPSAQAREWLAEKVRGLGFKEASHFLRNVGRMDVAIIDRHVIRAMKKEGLIKKEPKAVTRKKYLELEDALRPLAKQTGLEPGVLDFYLWFLETGEILK